MRTSALSRMPAFSPDVIDVLDHYANPLFRKNYFCRYQRATIILRAIDMAPILSISDEVKLSRNRVSAWISRAKEWEECLNTIAFEMPEKLGDAVLRMLDDMPRIGAPPVYTPAVRVQIVRVCMQLSKGLRLHSEPLEPACTENGFN